MSQDLQIAGHGLTGYPLAGDGHGSVTAPEGAGEHVQAVVFVRPDIAMSWQRRGTAVPDDRKQQLLAVERIIRLNEWFMRVLGAVRACELPDAYVGGGVIRTIVWDYLHGYAVPSPLADVDVGFFNPLDLSPARDRIVEAQLRAALPEVPWQAKNQAAVHLWYERVFGYAVPPLTSSQEAIATFPETVTSIGVRLLLDGNLEIVAPCGLDDLLHMILRRNPRRVTVERFRQRLAEKTILEKWPRVRIVDG